MVHAFRTVTLEVTPRIAEKIAVAQTIGTLSLSLRSIADNEGELEQAIASGDVKVPDNATPEQEEALLRQAMSRPIDKGTTYVTGGDVSRFQRTSMPARDSRSSSAPASTPVAAPRNQSVISGGGNTAPAAPAGPVVRVTRGKSTEQVPVGGAGVATSQQQGIRDAASMLPAAQASIPR